MRLLVLFVYKTMRVCAGGVRMALDLQTTVTELSSSIHFHNAHHRQPAGIAVLFPPNGAHDVVVI